MEKPKNLALIVARRQKRRQYWQDRLAGDKLDGDRARDIKEKLGTYALLLSKLAKAGTEEELKDAEGRIQGIERELTALFEARRLMTSEIGTPVVGGYPER